MFKALEEGKLCIAPFEDAFYRAKIISFGANRAKSLHTLHEDLLVNVVFVDYGNQAQVSLKDLREITPDLVDRLPRGFALRCSLDVTESALASYSELLAEFLDSGLFEVKCRARDERTGLYLVDLHDAQTKESFTDLFK